MRISMSILHDLCEDDSCVCEYAVACVYIREEGLNGGGGVKCRNKVFTHEHQQVTPKLRALWSTHIAVSSDTFRECTIHDTRRQNMYRI